MRLFALARDIENDDAARIPDLWCRKPNADGLIHRLQHVVHQPPDLGVDRRDGSRLDLEPRIGSRDDREQCHGNQFYVGCVAILVNISGPGRAARADVEQLLTIPRDNGGFFDQDFLERTMASLAKLTAVATL